MSEQEPRKLHRDHAVAETADGHLVMQAGIVIPPCQVWPWGEISEWCLMPLDEICPEHH